MMKPKGAAMENLGMIGAVGIGAVVALTPAVLVWALVMSGLRQMVTKNAHDKLHGGAQAGKADA
jgi:hypothetical protein